MKRLSFLSSLILALFATVSSAATTDECDTGYAYGAAHFPSYYSYGNIWGRCYDDYGAQGVFTGRLHDDYSVTGTTRSYKGNAYVYGAWNDYGFEACGEFYFFDYYTYTYYVCTTCVAGDFYYDYYRRRYTWSGGWETCCVPVTYGGAK